jgi:hypothetical protein
MENENGKMVCDSKCKEHQGRIRYVLVYSFWFPGGFPFDYCDAAIERRRKQNHEVKVIKTYKRGECENIF